VENLALDPGYTRLRYIRAVELLTLSKAAPEFGYLHGKKRAHANIVDTRGSYGIGEEHRVFLTMMEEIYQILSLTLIL
jgi:hypothetical protein